MNKWMGLACAVLLLGTTGCEEMKPTMPDHIRRIAIPTFLNQTSQPGIDQEISQKVTQEVLVDGRLSVVPMQQADGLLEGTITQYLQLPLVRDANQVPQQYKLQISVDLVFTDLVDKKQLWTTRSNLVLTPELTVVTTPGVTPAETPVYTPTTDSMNTAALREFTTYWVMNPLGVKAEDEPTARQRVEDQIARRVVRRLLDGY